MLICVNVFELFIWFIIEGIKLIIVIMFILNFGVLLFVVENVEVVLILLKIISNIVSSINIWYVIVKVKRD